MILGRASIGMFVLVGLLGAFFSPPKEKMKEKPKTSEISIYIDFVDPYQRAGEGVEEKIVIGGRIRGIENHSIYKVVVFSEVSGRYRVQPEVGAYATVDPGGVWERSGVRPGEKIYALLLRKEDRLPLKAALSQAEFRAIPRLAEVIQPWPRK